MKSKTDNILRLILLNKITSFIIFTILFDCPFPSSAQIVPDGTLPDATVINTNENITEITGGTKVGNNLFHSFEQFSLLQKTAAFFKNSQNIENIFSRVTGNLPSKIDGLIAANGSANLFLLNPKGIFLGPNASLNIGGSFIATSAETILFDNDGYFSAKNLDGSSLLKIKVPLGLQYGSNPGNITLENTTNNFAVNPGKTLAFLGGKVNLSGSYLAAPEGNITIISQAQEGKIFFDNHLDQLAIKSDLNNLKYDDINLTNATVLNTSGNSGGNIYLQGKKIQIKDGSALIANTLGNGQEGRLTIEALESLQVIGLDPIYNLPTSLLADIYGQGTNQGSQLSIKTKALSIQEGGQISASTYGEGKAGNVKISAENIQITGYGITQEKIIIPSSLTTAAYSESIGDGGKITIETEDLIIIDGAQIATSNFGGLGKPGFLDITAKNIEIKGSNPINNKPSGLYSELFPETTTDGSNITLKTENLLLTDKAQIAATALGFGNGGNIFIETGKLIVNNGAQIATATANSGNGGELSIYASDSIKLSGMVADGRSGLFASALKGIGNGGNINIFTNRLVVEDGATISVSNFQSLNLAPPGLGAAGNLNIEARSITLDKQGILTAAANAGEKGNITLTSSQITLRGASIITTNAQGTATGGNINLKTKTLTALENSDITANAKASFGGKVKIESQGIFGTQVRQEITNASDISASSELGAGFDGVVQLNRPEVDTSSGIVKLSSQTIAPQERIVAGCAATEDNRFTVVGREGLPEEPTKSLFVNNLWRDFRPLSIEKQEENFSVKTPKIITQPSPIVEAQGWIISKNGQVILTADPPNYNLASLATNSSSCSGNL